ncbi:hypothetical protein E2562_034453 [Oryza meyeriana var. granulata]|uniref:Uncharacterized protein n=1 Tax=Oryza meyeriana var. granulata TaxID=110450 RepID=A0A6G1CWF2_9ORYZ|nr:hypothetical protein E2562_034453 [Oryza meyeriana var. granulata]
MSAKAGGGALGGHLGHLSAPLRPESGVGGSGVPMPKVKSLPIDLPDPPIGPKCRTTGCL